MSLPAGQVALGILAGGQARRLGGADKALAKFRGEGLAERTFAALGQHFAQAMISYNGAAQERLPRGLAVVPDLREGFPGPLAGIESLLAACRAPWLLTVPVDLAQLPGQLLQRLGEGKGRGVYAHDADGEQPLVALWPVAASRVAVGAALNAGERAVHRVQAIMGFAACDLSPWRFGNLNSPEDLETSP